MFDYKIVRYDDYTIPLAKTDLDVRIILILPTFRLIFHDLYKVMEGKGLQESVPDGKLLGMTVEMILDSSTYATMVIRELTKSETGTLYQRHIQSTVVDKAEGLYPFYHQGLFLFSCSVSGDAADVNPEGDDEDAFIEGGGYVPEEGLDEPQ